MILNCRLSVGLWFSFSIHIVFFSYCCEIIFYSSYGVLRVLVVLREAVQDISIVAFWKILNYVCFSVVYWFILINFNIKWCLLALFHSVTNVTNQQLSNVSTLYELLQQSNIKSVIRRSCIHILLRIYWLSFIVRPRKSSIFHEYLSHYLEDTILPSNKKIFDLKKQFVQR